MTDAKKKEIDSYRWIPWILVPLVFIAFASHPTRKFYFDGVVFASIIEHSMLEKLFNPHHLLYTAIFYLIHNAIERVSGFEVQALYVMQWANIAIGALGAGLMWRLIRRLTHDPGIAILVTLLGCFSYTYWHYSTDADTYIISTIFLILAADRLELVLRHREPRFSDFVFIGIMHALSVLFHQLNIFFIVCVIGTFVFGGMDGSKREKVRWCWTYAVSMVIPVAISYLAVGIFFLGHRTFESFIHWITEYGHESSYWVKSASEIPIGTLNGYLMVFFHRTSLQPGIFDYNLGLAFEEGRLLKGIIRKVFGYYSLGFLFFMYLSAFYNIGKFRAQYPKASALLLSWLAPYVVFQFFFMPMNYFYKLFIFIPLLVLFGWYGTIVTEPERKYIKYPVFAVFVFFAAIFEPILALILAFFILGFEFFKPWKNQLYRWGLIILVGFLPLYNFISGIEPESHLENNPEVASALLLKEYVSRDDILIFEGGYDYPDGWIISALAHVDVITLRKFYGMSETERDDLISSGKNIYLHPNIEKGSMQVKAASGKLGIPSDELYSVIERYEWGSAFVKNGREYLRLVRK